MGGESSGGGGSVDRSNPNEMRSREMAEATNRALTATYANQPEGKIFKYLTNIGSSAYLIGHLKYSSLINFVGKLIYKAILNSK